LPLSPSANPCVIYAITRIMSTCIGAVSKGKDAGLHFEKPFKEKSRLKIGDTAGWNPALHYPTWMGSELKHSGFFRESCGNDSGLEL